MFLPMRRDAAGKHRHYAFVHYTERPGALAAVEAAAGEAAPTIDGVALQVGGASRGSGPCSSVPYWDMVECVTCPPLHVSLDVCLAVCM